MIIKIHQALHGYAGGHRQLACSVSLSTKDARLMLIMSDVSGPGISSLGQPYFTGYPLAESGMYALAKTWPAPEMSRPGCVWTHTLLIGFADLASLASPSVMAELFQRPMVATSLDGYATDLVVEPQDTLACNSFSPDAASWFVRLATAVYEHPDEQVWARRNHQDDADYAVLRLWDQQWPRLKRSFLFCTLTSRDRSQEGMPFDLQLSPGIESSSHLRFLSSMEGFEAGRASTGPWLEDLLHDAKFPHSSSLRPFLRKLGADMLGGREAMRSFCSLHAALEANNTDSVSDAVRYVERSEVFSASRLVRSMVVQAAVANFSLADSDVVDFVLDNFSLLPESALHDNLGLMALVLWERDPKRFLKLGADSNAEVRDAIRVGAGMIPTESVLEKLPLLNDLAAPLLSFFPAIAENPSFWANSQMFPTSAAQVGIDLSSDAVFQAIMLGLREPAAIKAAAHAVGALKVLESLQYLISTSNLPDQAHSWLRVVCADTKAVARFLADSSSPSGELLLILAAALKPDAVPNISDVDPWYLALNALIQIENELPLELQVFGFRRALSRRSTCTEGLLKLTFEPLYRATKKTSFRNDQWRLLEDSLSWERFALPQDRPSRLLHATARVCLDLELHANALIQLVQAEELFFKLLEEIWLLWGGTRYLRSVSDAVEQNSPRSRLLNNFIKKRSILW